MENRFFFATNKEIGDDGGIPYRGLFGQPGYIPLVVRPELAEPVLCTNVKKIPVSFIPIDTKRADRQVDAQIYSVVNVSAFSTSVKVNPNSLKELFSVVQFYPDPNFKISEPETEPRGSTLQRSANASEIEIEIDEILPTGWEKRKAKNGNIYYVDHNTQTTHWRAPKMDDHNASTNSFSGSPPATFGRPSSKLGPAVPFKLTTSVSVITPDEDDADIPVGWEKRKTAKGKTYYLNHATKTTQWDKPTETGHKELNNMCNDATHQL